MRSAPEGATAPPGLTAPAGAGVSPEGLDTHTGRGRADEAGSLLDRPRAPAATGDESAPSRLVACHRCGAVNAASRRRCARCRADISIDSPELDGERAASDDAASLHAPGASAMPVGSGVAGGGDRGGSRDTAEPPLPGVLVLATVIASIAVLAVAFTMLSARGVGPFGGPGAEPTDPTQAAGVEIADITASSALPPAGSTTYDAANLIDDDPTTAWNEGESGDGAGERLELTLAGPTDVTGLLVWNGYQAGDDFAQHNRVRMLRLDIGDRIFRVRLLDRRGPQAIDLPAPVTAERIGLEIVATFPGNRYNDAALSELEVLGVPADDQPSTNV